MTSCYKVTLPTTNAVNNTARVDGTYIPVEHGVLYVCASDAGVVGSVFQNAIKIERVGIAYAKEAYGDNIDSHQTVGSSSSPPPTETAITGCLEQARRFVEKK